VVLEETAEKAAASLLFLATSTTEKTPQRKSNLTVETFKVYTPEEALYLHGSLTVMKRGVHSFRLLYEDDAKETKVVVPFTVATPSTT